MQFPFFTKKSNHHISPQPGCLHEHLMHVAYETTKEIRTCSFARSTSQDL